MNQDKNTIKAVIAVMAGVILGEGVLGWGLHWPLLLILTDWDGIFWLGLGVGILLATFSAIPIGLPSLFIVVVLALISLLLGVRKGSERWLIIVSVAANMLFDKVFGLSWSWLEGVVILIAAIMVFSWEGRRESIKVSYK